MRLADVLEKKSPHATAMDTPRKFPKLRRIRITESRKPDIFTTGGKHYFINGVIRVSLSTPTPYRR